LTDKPTNRFEQYFVNLGEIISRNKKWIIISSCSLFLFWILSDYLNNGIIHKVDTWGYENISETKLIILTILSSIVLGVLAVIRFDSKHVREHKLLYTSSTVLCAIYVYSRYSNLIYFIRSEDSRVYMDLFLIPFGIIFAKGLSEFHKSISRIPSPKYTILTDDPLTTSDDDALNIKSIAQHIVNVFYNNYTKCFTIGINGIWGKGKSTFTEFIKEKIQSDPKLKEDSIIVDFNPYEVLSDKSMELRFFEELSHLVSKHDKNVSNRINGYIKTVIKEEKWYSKIPSGVIESNINIKSVNQALQGSNKKLIIFIDDIDRLVDLNDIINVFQLIRNCNGLENTYIIANYDKINVNKIFGNSNVESTYIDKIINYEYKLPILNERIYFNRIIAEILSKVLISIDLPEDSDDETKEKMKKEVENFVGWRAMTIEPPYFVLDKGYNELVRVVKSDEKNENWLMFSDLFSSVREIKRFLISFSVKYRGMKGNANFIDCFLLHLIKFNDEEYSKLVTIFEEKILEKRSSNLTINIFDPSKLDPSEPAVQLDDVVPMPELTSGGSEEPELKGATVENIESPILLPSTLKILELLCANRNDSIVRSFRNFRNTHYYFFETHYDFEISTVEIDALLIDPSEIVKYQGDKKQSILDWISRNYQNIDDHTKRYGALIILFENLNSYSRETFLFNETIYELFYHLNNDQKTKLVNFITDNKNDSSVYFLNQFLSFESKGRGQKFEKDIVQKALDKIVNSYASYIDNFRYLNHQLFSNPELPNWFSKGLDDSQDIILYYLKIENINNTLYLKLKNSSIEITEVIRDKLKDAVKTYDKDLFILTDWGNITTNGFNLFPGLAYTSRNYLNSKFNTENWMVFDHPLITRERAKEYKEMFDENDFISKINKMDIIHTFSINEALRGGRYNIKFNIDIPIAKPFIRQAYLQFQVDDHLYLHINDYKDVLIKYSQWDEQHQIDITKYFNSGENIIEMSIENRQGTMGKRVRQAMDNPYGIIFKLVIDYDVNIFVGKYQ
jgi:hypothetical protein